MNVKLQHLIRDVTGRMGMDIILAILAGERAPRKKYRQKGCKNREASIARALRGDWREEHLFELEQAVALCDTFQHKMSACDQRIDAHLNTFADCHTGQQPIARRERSKPKDNVPIFDVQGQVYRISGPDLTRVEGIDSYTVQKRVSEVGLDMTPWKNGKRFASWLRLCLGSKISGGKLLSSRSNSSANLVAFALWLVAHSPHNSKSAPGAYLRRMKARFGAQKAITATAHKLARLVYGMLRCGTRYVDKGQDWYEQQYRSRVAANLHHRTKSMEYRLVSVEDTITSRT